MRVYVVTSRSQYPDAGEDIFSVSAVCFSLAEARRLAEAEVESEKREEEAEGMECFVSKNGNKTELRAGDHYHSWTIAEKYISDSIPGKELASLCSDFVNNFSSDREAFVKAMCREHKTLQQSFMRLVCHYIREMANNSYDDRNEASVMLAKKFVKVIEESDGLPFI